MSARGEVEVPEGVLLDAWLTKLEAAHVLMGAREAAEAELGRWLSYLSQAASGDDSAERELFKLVAFHARGLGAEGRPASAALMQAVLLQDVVIGIYGAKPGSPAPPSGLLAVLRELLRVVVDAHALGSSERTKLRHHLEIRDFSPVIRLGSKTIVGFLLGAMERDLIDAMIGRLLREAARTHADEVVLDVFGAARDNETFQRTIQAFLRSEVGCRIRLTLSGLRDAEGTKRALAALGCNMERVRFEPDVNTALQTIPGLEGAQ